MFIVAQGHVFAMEISSGEEFYIACDNTGAPLAVFSNNGLLLKQVCVCVNVFFLAKEESAWVYFVYLFKSSWLSVCVCTVGTVHGIWGGLLWFQPRLCAGNWFPWRPVWSSDTTAAFWRQRLRYPRWKVFTHVQSMHLRGYFLQQDAIPAFYCHVRLECVFFYEGGPLLTSAHGHMLVKNPSPSTSTCSEATTPSARFIRSKNMSQVTRKHLQYKSTKEVDTFSV